MTTPGLGLTEHVSAGANGHINANEAYRVLELFSSIELKQFQLVAPPGTPVEGELNVVGTGGTGAFAGHDGELALYLNAAWRFILPKTGMRLGVSGTATHSFQKLMIEYSGVESLWYPSQPFFITATDYWTGRYFDGHVEKMYARSYVGNIASGTLEQQIAHSLTPDFAVGAWVEGFITDNVVVGKSAGTIPGRIPGAQLALHMDATNILFQSTADMGVNFDYRFTVYFAK